MQEQVARAHPASSWHAGDLAWMSRRSSQLELEVWITLFEDASGEPVAWVWPAPNGAIDVFAAPAALDGELAGLLIDAGEATLRRAAAAGDPIDCARLTVTLTDAVMVEALRGRGYAEVASESYDLNRRAAAGAAEPRLPDGYRFAGVDDPLVDRRVEAQRAAFAPSTLTAPQYRRARARWPYRSDLDRVVLDADGEVAAFCTAWYDDRHGTGLLEPVGTHPAHRRRGLATAVCLDAVRRLGDAGAGAVQVTCEAASAGCATYLAAGFTPALRVLTLERRLDGGAARG